jgi:glycosyltransferase involved in cell wall biosynthesis
LKFRHYILKRRIEDVFIYPFILLGKIIAWFKPLEQEYETFFFFPFYHTGGAEKVHAQIVQAAGNENTIVFFTRTSADNRFLNDFAQSGAVIKNIAAYTDNKYLYFLNLVYRGIVTTYINRQKVKPVVFNGQCNFGYKIAPWVNFEIPQLELIHSFNTFSLIRLPFLSFIKQTIMISKVRIQDHLQQYDKLEVPAQYRDRIGYIVNGIPLPWLVAPKNLNTTINILYVGRGTAEKRVHLVAQMAQKAAAKKLPVQFTFMGDVQQAIPTTLLPYCTLLGNLNDVKLIEEAYQQAHIVVITSDTEGFPMVIEEGMARGCVILATPVGDIPLHVQHNTNGFLFSTIKDEAVIVQEGVDYLSTIVNNRALLARMAEANITYARAHFSLEIFNQQYQQLIHQFRNS